MTSFVWLLLNSYLFISLCAIFFNFYTISSQGSKAKLHSRLRARLNALVTSQLDLISQSKPTSRMCERKIIFRLCSASNVLIFYDVCLKLKAERGADFDSYIAQWGKSLVFLCGYYLKCSTVSKASFAWLLAGLGCTVQPAMPFLTHCVLNSRSIYCRENALIAMYRGGSCDDLVRLYRAMSERDIRHNRKLLTDGLMSFHGDKIALANQLWDSFDQLSPHIRLAFVDFIRLSGQDFSSRFLPLLDDPLTDDELCYSVLRYFGRHPDERICMRLISFIKSPPYGLWEYAAVSSSVLRSFRTPEVIEALRCALSDANWYVRYNSAESLVGMQLGENFYNAILNGSDLYARDILAYMLERAGRILN